MPKLANIDWANNEVAWTIYNDLISIDAQNENIHRNSFTDFLHSVIYTDIKKFKSAKFVYYV